jgi:hypothetical protein
MPFMITVLLFLVIVVAGIIQSYCEFGRQARPDIQPNILKGKFRYVMEGLWIFLMIIASAGLFLQNALLGVAAIVIFWLGLPFIINPILRNRLLPSWEEVKKELEPKGYNEKDYWRGGWWMKETKEKRKIAKK